MNIWSTSIPTAHDFPIWAFTDNDSEVVLLRYPEEFNDPITWCHASIPQAPKGHLRKKYEMLSDSSVGEAWGAYEWFKAGYNYSKSREDQPAKSPFVCPEEYWFEPNESAYDEKP